MSGGNPKPSAYVLDSWAIIAYFQGEPAAKKISDMLGEAMEKGMPVFMSVVNLGEVWYVFAREESDSEADSVISDIRNMGVEIVDAAWPLTRQAAVLKSKNKMSYADAFAAALANQKNAALVTGDPEFLKVKNLGQLILLK